MRKCDLFKANKTMSARVEEYVKVRILHKAIMKRYADSINAIDTLIKGLDNLVGSIHEDDIPEKREQYLADREDLIAKRDEELKKEATFEFTDNDKTFRKALKGLPVDDPAIATAVIAWFKAYDLDVEDTDLLADILSAIGGKEDMNRLVDSEGIDGVSVDSTRALSMLYWVAFKHMATVGTIKPAQIPDIIKNNFGTAAKAAKKAAKNNK